MADFFAEIARSGMNLNHASLAEQIPPERVERVLPLNGNGEFVPTEKINDNERLYEELAKVREKYSVYEQNLAPAAPCYRERKYLTDFNFRRETDADRKSFRAVLDGEGEWQTVSIPHYEGPVGECTAFYQTKFVLDEIPSDKAAFLSFKGVDYKASVFINDRLCGVHEGFFAPFFFDITPFVLQGENVLTVVVENDYKSGDDGSKIYAATGPGWDDPLVGWHHCPAGMGIFQDVFIEICPRVFVHDIFVRTLDIGGKAEAWIELYSADRDNENITLSLSAYGQNFSETVFENLLYKPSTHLMVGMGDSLSEADEIKSGRLGNEIPLAIRKGINTFIIPFNIENPRLWNNERPWLYQLQVALIGENGKEKDTAVQQFGIRTFRIDENTTPKGAMYLNERRIRLRGANTMGHEQQCVMKKDFNQLRDDILLAKICNMNYLRLTQRPVQKEIYEFCDRLGMMIQTDLPLFGVLRRNQYAEAIRQAGEMERLIRAHACCILSTFINEPFPNSHNRPHLHLTRSELESLFESASAIIHMYNPDRSIKPVDGDYDPPAPSLPDNHCYCGWYNGHGIDIGKLNKGYWIPTKQGWLHGCGEFGAEGLDCVDLMRRRYPKEWLPADNEDESEWSPNRIIGAQTGDFHYFFYETPKTLEEWVEKSCEYQAWVDRFMTEAYRRDTNMESFAIHLFIDAFPAGWMKTIMDCERRAKSAYFEYRKALSPLMVSLRADNYKLFTEKKNYVEAWICNDFDTAPRNAKLLYYLKSNGKVILSGSTAANVPVSGSLCQGLISVDMSVSERSDATLYLALADEKGNILCDTDMALEFFPPRKDDVDFTQTFLSYDSYKKNEEEILNKIKNGATVVLSELPTGVYTIADSNIEVKDCSMLPVHFVSRDTGHPLADGFKPKDFRLWYDSQLDRIAPIMERTFTADNGFEAVLTGANLDNNGKWKKAFAVAEKKIEKGSLIISQLKLKNRTMDNPIADEFVRRLASKEEKA